MIANVQSAVLAYYKTTLPLIGGFIHKFQGDHRHCRNSFALGHKSEVNTASYRRFAMWSAVLNVAPDVNDVLHV